MRENVLTSLTFGAVTFESTISTLSFGTLEAFSALEIGVIFGLGLIGGFGFSCLFAFTKSKPLDEEDLISILWFLGFGDRWNPSHAEGPSASGFGFNVGLTLTTGFEPFDSSESCSAMSFRTLRNTLLFFSWNHHFT